MYITFINPFYLSDKTIWLILVSGLFLICMIYAASKLPHRNPVYTAVSNAAPIVFGLAVLVGSVICLGFMMQMIQREDDESPFRVHAFRVMEVASGYELRISDIGLTAAGKPSFDSVGETQIKLAGIISDPALEPASAYQQRIQFLRTLVGQNITARTFYQRTSMVSTVTQVEYPGEAVMQDGRSLNEVLLHDGYAIFNINDDLYPDERRRLDAAENDAISHKRGVWAGAWEQEYVQLRSQVRQANDESTKLEVLSRSDFRPYLYVQFVLLCSIGVLIVCTRSDPPTNRLAKKYLFVPCLLLFPELGSQFWSADSWSTRGGYKFEAFTILQLLYFILVPILLVVGVFVFVDFLRFGPLRLWETVLAQAKTRRRVDYVLWWPDCLESHLHTLLH